MNWDESEAINSYLKSIMAGKGLPSQKEIGCLERIAMWKKAAVFVEEFEEMESAGGGGVNCSRRRGGGLPGLRQAINSLAMPGESTQSLLPAGVPLRDL
jgi:hypothetical protein